MTDRYTEDRVRHALAEDPRLGELDIDVHIHDDELTLSGTVGSEQRRRIAAELVGSLCPGHRIHNRLEILIYPEPGAPR